MSGRISRRSFLVGTGAMAFASIAARAQPPDCFVHPGALHTQDDLDRMAARVAAGAQPWIDSWSLLVANPHSSLGWRPRPVATIIRGGSGQNYSLLYNDIAAAFACALRWHISGDAAYADKAVEIMNAWSYTLTTITGTSDKFLAAGIYGYEFANAAEIMRVYDGWAAADFAQFQSMMLSVFYPMNHDFLVRHNGACISHYWCNWDACNMASIISIGVLCDSSDIFNEAVDYYQNGAGNGSIWNAVHVVDPDTGLGQWQESGRDQAHSMLGLGLLATVCGVAWNQGVDLYGYGDNRLLAGAEYIARYNLGYDVQYQPYNNCDNVNQTTISAGGRGGIRPIWEQIYNHYVNQGVAAPNTAAYAQLVRPEGGGGNYGPNSGGYDHLGYGTLTFTLTN